MENRDESSVKPVNKIKYLRSVIVIEKSGVPIISRHYQVEENDNQEKQHELFAGFFAAINLFSQSTLKQEVKDIRMGDSKYYITNQGDYIIVIEVSYPTDLNETQKEFINDQINHLMVNVQGILSLYLSFSDSLDNEVESIASEIDTLVFEIELALNKDLAALFIDRLSSDTILTPQAGIDTKDEIKKKSFWKRISGLFRTS